MVWVFDSAIWPASWNSMLLSASWNPRYMYSERQVVSPSSPYLISLSASLSIMSSAAEAEMDERESRVSVRLVRLGRMMTSVIELLRGVCRMML